MSARRQGDIKKEYSKIVFAVSLYWVTSISLVFLNKYLLSSADLKLDAPVFVTWFQCAVTVALCYGLAKLAKQFPDRITFPEFSIDQKLSREVLPLSFVFVAMIMFNNLCLKHVGVSFYYVGRSLTTVFNVVCTYLILGDKTSMKAIGCCLIIISGFLMGVQQEDASGSLDPIGVFYGVAASACVALNAIYTKKTLPIVGDNIWRLTMYNNINAAVIFVPFMLFNGDVGTILSFPKLMEVQFWAMMTASGFLGFAMGYVTGLQIQTTSALTHNISGTAKAAAQTVIGVVYYAEVKTGAWWLSNFVVLFGSALYTYVKQQAMKQSFGLRGVVSLDKLTSDQVGLLPKQSDLDSEEEEGLLTISTHGRPVVPNLTAV